MTSPNETPRGTSRTGSPPDPAGQTTAGKLSEESSRLASEVAEKARSATASMADRAGDFAEKAKQRAMDAVEEGKDMGVSSLEGVARATHAAADVLEEKVPEIAGYAHRAARSIEDFSHGVRNRSVSDLVRTANDYARREPVTVFGVTMLAGFAFARFLSSSPLREEPRGRNQGLGRSQGMEPGNRVAGGGMAYRGGQSTGRETADEPPYRGRFGNGPSGSTMPSGGTTEGVITSGTSRGDRGGDSPNPAPPTGSGKRKADDPAETGPDGDTVTRRGPGPEAMGRGRE